MLKFATAEILSAHPSAHATPALARTAHRADFSHHQVRPGFLYVRSRAISSRCNDNFDEFPAEELEKSYKTFIGKPVFVNHVNHDTDRARGVVIDAALHRDRNPDGSPDTWVEVLMEVDGLRFPKLAAAIMAKPPRVYETSMGCDVDYSICSACGNKATRPEEYCRHIPAAKGTPYAVTDHKTGTRQTSPIREICYGLRFFENSLLVEAPADPTAQLLGVDATGLDKTSAARRTAMPSQNHSRPEGFYSTITDPYGDKVSPGHCPLSDPNCDSRAHSSDVYETLHEMEGFDPASRSHPQRVSSIEYAVHPCGKHVDVHELKTEPDETGNGYASALMDDLYDAYPHAIINHGRRTREGAGWWSSYEDPDPSRSIADTSRYAPSRTARYTDTGPVCSRCHHEAGTGPGCPKCDTARLLKGAIGDLDLGAEGHDMAWQYRDAGPTVHGTCRNCGRTTELGAPGMRGDNTKAPSAHSGPCPATDRHAPDAADRLTHAVDYLPEPLQPRHQSSRTAGYGYDDRYINCDQGHCHWDPERTGSGGMLIHHGGHVLLGRRADWVQHPGTWGIPGGALHEDETPEEGAHREATEELGPLPSLQHTHTHHDDHGGWAYHTIVAEAPHRFHPEGGDAETDEFRWVHPRDFPDYDLHPGFAASWPHLAPHVRGGARAAVKTATRAEGLSFEHEDTETGGSKWPMLRTLRAVHPEHGTVGALSYWLPKTSRGPLAIKGVYVPQQHQRNGVATALMDEVQRMHPASAIQHGDRTNAGRAWWEAYSDSAPKQLLQRGRTLATLTTEAMPPRHTDPADHPFFQEHPVSAAHVVAHWADATPEEKNQGERWYADAHLLAHALAHTYAGGDTGKAAGVISAYSPRTSWAANMHNAARSLASGRALKVGEGLSIMGVHHSLADKIMNGEHYDKVLKGPKTNAFAKLIHHGGIDPVTKQPMPHVVIDRHALSVAAGQRLSEDDVSGFPSSTPHYYNHVAKIYADAAAAISKAENRTVAPHQVQATTWLVRIRHNQEEDRNLRGGGGKGRVKNQENQLGQWRDLHPTLLPGGAGSDNMHMSARASLRNTGAMDSGDHQHQAAEHQLCTRCGRRLSRDWDRGGQPMHCDECGQPGHHRECCTGPTDTAKALQQQFSGASGRITTHPSYGNVYRADHPSGWYATYPHGATYLTIGHAASDEHHGDAVHHGEIDYTGDREPHDFTGSNIDQALHHWVLLNHDMKSIFHPEIRPYMRHHGLPEPDDQAAMDAHVMRGMGLTGARRRVEDVSADNDPFMHVTAAEGDPEYTWGKHKAPDKSGAPFHDPGRNGHYPEMPRDLEGDYSDLSEALNKANGNPRARVRIYRTVPPGVTQINPGDWVTPSLALAQGHTNIHAMGTGRPGHILRATVDARHLRTDGNDLREWGYHGPGIANAAVHWKPPQLPYHPDYAGGAVQLSVEDHDFVHGNAPLAERAHHLMQAIPRYNPDRGPYATGAMHKNKGNYTGNRQDAHYDAQDNADNLPGADRPPTLFMLHAPERSRAISGISFAEHTPPETPLNAYTEHTWDPAEVDEDSGMRHTAGLKSLAADDEDDDYKIMHEAPDASAAPLHDLTHPINPAIDGGSFPDDVYDHPELYTGYPDDHEMLHSVRRARGNPDAKIRIYRAVPQGVQHINTGDWVTLSKEYAKEHAQSMGNGVVLRTSSPARHLHTEGNDLQEWAYHGPQQIGMASWEPKGYKHRYPWQTDPDWEKKSKLAYGETKAPAQVDTLRDDACDVCGNKEGWDGQNCPVCLYMQVPDMFRDPDTGVARTMDLRGVGDAAAQTAMDQGSDAIPGGIDQSGEQPPGADPANGQLPGGVAEGPGGEMEDPQDATADGEVRTLGDGDGTSDPAAAEAEGQTDLQVANGEGGEMSPAQMPPGADVLTCPACGFQTQAGAPVSSITDNPSLPASAGPVAGDVCPNCGKAVLMSAAEEAGLTPPPEVPALDPEAVAAQDVPPVPGEEPADEAPQEDVPEEEDDDAPQSQSDDGAKKPKSPAVKRVS